MDQLSPPTIIFPKKSLDLNFLKSQQKKILYDWNDTDKEYPRDKTIQALFEEQVERTPNHIALIYENKKLTYRELNEKANQLANYLRQTYDIRCDTLIALCLDRSEQMLIVILAVLKSGGAYVPIDPSYPDERIKYILEDTQTKVVLTNEAYQEKLKKISTTNTTHIQAMDRNEIRNNLEMQPTVNLIISMQSNHLAYVIYTSGTTGQPKGVMIEHKSVINLIKVQNELFGLTNIDTIKNCLWYSNYVFDAHVWEIYVNIVNGHRLHIINNEVRQDIKQLSIYIKNNAIDIATIPPTLLNDTDLLALDVLVVAGDKTSQKVFDFYKEHYVKVINAYGPSEVTVCASFNYYTDNGPTNIGSPISNVKCYVLDNDLKPLPIGEIGELYIGGEGLARGYLNRPELTAERFIKNAFQTKAEKKQNKNARLYKTGDLVRWLPEGNLEYIGRNDFQVKIRGHRIELGEIENVLSSYEGIKQSVVLAKDYPQGTGDKYLVAYYVKDLDLKHEDIHYFIDLWRTTYQSQYLSLDIDHFKQNIKGWNSSYTGKAIKKEDMFCWINETTDRIKQLNPKVVLEIGSGSGLILFNLIDHCDYYYATDFSENVIDYTDQVIKKFGYSEKISALACAADEIPYYQFERSYDTVIINSVTQYFPCLDYLESVLTAAILNMEGPGQIFIGDIRDYRLLKCFHYSVQKYKNKHVRKEEVDYFTDRDKELLISPEYFIQLKKINPSISDVEILPKLGKANHEINKYRYDVILHIHKNKNQVYVDSSQFVMTLNFENCLTKKLNKDYLCIKYPNKRILKDYTGYKKLYGLEINKIHDSNLLSIDEIINKVKSNNFKIKFFLDIDDPLYLNMILYQRKLEKDINIIFSGSQSPKSNFANHPLLVSKLVESQLGKEIQEYLSTRLPHYMVPEHYIYLDKLPLTINGKLDRNALPEPAWMSNDHYSSPKNELERDLCKIWSDVLGLPIGKIGTKDHFFRLGGHSLKATQVISRIRNQYSVDIPVRSLFERPTVEQIARLIKDNKEQTLLPPLVKQSRDKDIPLSFAQQRLWFLDQLINNKAAYHIPVALKLTGMLHIEALQISLQEIVNRHESLRTYFKTVEGEAQQVVEDKISLSLKQYDISQAKEKEAKADSIIAAEAENVFDLGRAPLIRTKLIILSPKEHVLLITMHHVVSDGWSMGVFIQELNQLYNHYAYHEPLELSELPIQYVDYSLWQRKWLTEESLANQLSYWQNKLKGSSEMICLPLDKQRPMVSSYQGKEYQITIAKELVAEFKVIGDRQEVTLFTLLVAVVQVLLSRYSHQEDIVIGTSLAGRQYKEIEGLIGFFVNTLALRVNLKDDFSFNELLQQVKETVLEAYVRQDIPFEQLVDHLKVNRSLNKHPLFQVMLVLQNTDHEQIKLKKIKTELLKIENQPARFDLTFNMTEKENGELSVSIEYATDLFYEETIKRMTEHLVQLIHSIVKDPKQPISYLNLLTESERNKLLVEWNATHNEYKSHKTIQSLFEEQVRKTPNNIAVVYEDKKLTYREFNERSNQLANYLIHTQKIKPDTLIALCLDRSEQMLIAILAVLKSGGAYVPIDPGYPDERIKYILEDTQAKMVIINETYQRRLNELSTDKTTTNIIAIDNYKLQKQLETKPNINPDTSVNSTNLAYVIYTSGTTGQPKGVLQLHNNVMRLFKATEEWYGFNHKDVWTLFHSYVFDFTIWEMWGALIYGGKLVIPSYEQTRDLNLFYELCRQEKVTVLNLTPTVFYRFADIAINQEKQNKLINLRYVIFGGEALNLLQLKSWFNDYGYNKPKLINMYGITETTVHVTYKPINEEDVKEKSNIGKRIPDLKVYVLDSNSSLVPIGAIGELYIGGEGLSRGYLNRPDLTAERFIKNPFQTEAEKKQNKNRRLYKTGDLVRWLPDGNLEYIGRNDFQVKIRGYRIELSEIETILSSYEGVKQSVVLAKERTGIEGSSTENRYLAGYYVSEHQLDDEKILNYLSSKLPDHMVPSALVHLDKLPLTINGKLDRKALPDPEFTNKEGYVAPRDEIEERVCQIWAEVLGLAEDKVGIRDNFFRLGGNSILAIKLISRINKELNSSLSVSAIFKHTTVEKLVHSIQDKPEDNIVINKSIVDKEEEQILSFAQERLWFIERYEEGTQAYNVPMVFKLSKNIQLNILEESLRSIVNRHEILRTVIREDEEGTGYQLVMDDQATPLNINKIKVTTQDELNEAIKQEVNHVYDLSQEWPIRIGLYEPIIGKRKKEHYLSIVIHHIAFDGWSADILLKELKEYYRYYLEQSQELEAKLDLPNLTIQYKDFALWQRSYLRGERLEKQLTYWRTKLAGYETLNLMTDQPRPNQVDYRGANVSFELDAKTSTGLRELAKELKVSLYSVLLSGYYLMLRAYSHQNNIVVGTPIANRHYSQIENLIGFFINSLALRVEIDSKVSIKEFIQKVGQEVIEAQLHQDLPFEKLVEELKVEKDTSRHPIFQVLFQVQSFGNEIYGQTDRSAETNLFKAYPLPNYSYNVAKFDISTYINDGENNLKGNFNYAVGLYQEDTINRYIETYIEILKQLINLGRDKQAQIANLHYLNKEQYNQIINTWNKTDREYPRDKTIQILFGKQVEKTPDYIALVYEDKKLTYKELNERANRLANYLRDTQKIKPDTLIALCLDRSEYMLIAILAVLKAGGAYVPMDPNYPDERNIYILQDTQTKVVLTNEIYKNKLQGLADKAKIDNKISVIGIDSDKLNKELKLQLNTNPKTETRSNHLAYVIYTSGTTGQPKGVCGTHGGAINRFAWSWKEYPFEKVEVCCLKTSLSFVDHVAEIFSPLLSGMTAILLSNSAIKDMVKMINEINNNHVTRLVMVPSLLEVILQLGETELSKLKNLKYLFCSGEILPLKIVKDCYQKLEDVRLINIYGSSEVSADATYYEVPMKDIPALEDHFAGKSKIGKPLFNYKCYVLTDNLLPVPIGAVGELYIGGEGLARGYLNKPELTAERFIKNPFQTQSESKQNRNEMIYKTGDLVRWLSDGDLEYIGRTDFQIKIRGQRIELEEIEKALLNYEGIKQCVVLVKEQNENKSVSDKYLIGYYVSDNKLNEEKILNDLSTVLPHYMIPNVLIHLEKLPLTMNGKLDRKALPEPELTDSDCYLPPRNELEEAVCRIWADVLKLPEDKISIRDDFFRLGGNSISAIQLVSKLNKEFNNVVNLACVFKHHTIDKLAYYIAQNNGIKGNEYEF